MVGLAAATLWLLWRLTPGASPPIYDGLCVADPYRLLHSAPSPSSAAMTYPAGDSPVTDVRTAENPPQAELLMMSGALSSPGSPITVSVAPVPAPATRPARGSVDGNVYRFSATGAGGSGLSLHSPVTVLLRATRASPTRTMERFDGTTWKPLETFLEGCGDVYEANSTKLGDFALVITGQAPPRAPGGGPPVPLIAGALAVVLIAATLLLVRLGRTRGA